MPIKGHILIVDDEPVGVTVLASQLTKLGYSIAGIAGEGAEAVKLAETNRPDLVLMDIGLKGDMDGVEAATLIRSRHAVPVIYLTTKSDEETVERASVTDAHAYLRKPLHPMELHCTLQMALHRAAMDLRLTEEHKWFVTTLRCVRDGVIAADTNGIVKLMNPMAEKLTGWSEGEAVNRKLSEVFQLQDPKTREPVECAVKRVIRGKDGIHSYKLLVSRDGTRTTVEESVAEINNESGIMIGVVLVFYPAFRVKPPAQ